MIIYQHIVGHRQTAPRNERTHGAVLCDGVLKEIIGDELIMVNSFHHQLVKKLADCLVPDAYSQNEGYIEAFHLPEHKFLLGVQWHPEAYFAESESSSKLFEKFIEACKER